MDTVLVMGGARDLDWEPSVRFEQGMRQTVQWYLASSEWVGQISSGLYRRQRLGLLD